MNTRREGDKKEAGRDQKLFFNAKQKRFRKQRNGDGEKFRWVVKKRREGIRVHRTEKKEERQLLQLGRTGRLGGWMDGWMGTWPEQQAA